MLAVETELAVDGIDSDDVSLPELPLEELQGQFVDQLPLDHALQRAGAVRRVVAEVAEQRSGVGGELDLDALLANPAEPEAEPRIRAALILEFGSRSNRCCSEPSNPNS